MIKDKLKAPKRERLVALSVKEQESLVEAVRVAAVYGDGMYDEELYNIAVAFLLRIGTVI